ncbi:acyltransferase domain-containing protein [Micromonospora sp. M12]
MAAVEATAEEVQPLLDGHETAVGLAAVNAPRACVVSGDPDQVQRITTHFGGLGRKVRALRVSHAFHSPHLDAVLDDYRRVAESLRYATPRIPLVSTVTGEPLTAAQAADPGYWVRQLREPVRFLDAMRRLRADGATTYLEIGPDGVLSGLAEQCVGVAGVPVLRGRRPEVAALMSAVGHLHVHGVGVDWPPCSPAPAHAGHRCPRTPSNAAVSGPARATGAPRPWPAGATGSAGVRCPRWRPPGRPAPGSSSRTARTRWRTPWSPEAPACWPRPNCRTGTPRGRRADRRVLSLLPPDGTLTAMRALAATGLDAPLWLVTRRAVRVTDGDAPPDPAPPRCGASVACSPWNIPISGAASSTCRTTRPRPPRPAALPAGRRRWRRGPDRRTRQRRPRPAPGARCPGWRRGHAWQPRGTVLVTGGTGALGGHVARWLARAGRRTCCSPRAGRGRARRGRAARGTPRPRCPGDHRRL